MSKERNAKGQFPAGQSGNPGGWPRGFEKYLRDELKKMRVKVSDLDGNEIEVDGIQALVKRLTSIAFHDTDTKTAVVALKLLIERMYGLPKQKIQIDETPDEDDDSELDGLSVEELRVLAKVRAQSAETPSDDVH